MHSDDQINQKPAPERPSTRSADAVSPEQRIGRHRAPEPPHRFRKLVASTPVKAALATGVACCLGVVAVNGTRGATEVPREPVGDAVVDRVAAAEHGAASRSLERISSPAPSAPAPPSPSPTAVPTPAATRTAAPKKPAKPPRPTPVAGLTQAQMDNAKVIVDVGTEMKMPRRALVVALATAMQESNLYNYASGVLPESQNYPHQAIGWDYDSVGLFQQRPSMGWGTVRDLMRPAYAARTFYEALNEVLGWQEMSIAAAAQAVQVSAFPDAYAQHEQRATAVVAALH